MTTLLGPEDPAPAEVLRPRGTSTYVLTCEHAGKAFPRSSGTLGLSGPNLDRHITWDIGAAGVARQLSARLDAPCVLQTYSRLVVDCNRWPGAHDFIAVHSEDTDIPGNIGLSRTETKRREAEIFHPYHDAIRAILDVRERAARRSIVVAVHSCTPVYLGVERPWHIGVLYERDRRFAEILLALLGTASELVVGDNEPYFMTDEKDYSIPVHGERRGLLHVELEIRQDLIASADGQTRWAARLEGVLLAAQVEAERQDLA